MVKTKGNYPRDREKQREREKKRARQVREDGRGKEGDRDGGGALVYCPFFCLTQGDLDSYYRDKCLYS